MPSLRRCTPPPRAAAATKLLPELKLIPGFALDLTTTDSDSRAWDFDEKEMRDRVLRKLKTEKPRSCCWVADGYGLLHMAADQQSN